LKETEINEITGRLFRQEAGKMVSVLTRIFGLPHIEQAEDIVQDTFIKALSDWQQNGTPPNPEGWLYKTAKNRTIDILRRRKHADDYASEVSYLFKSEWTLTNSVNNLFLDSEIKDSQLRMIFAACHPALPVESQIAFTLKNLCGLGVREIARGLLTTEANINKRLFRAKNRLREGSIKFEIPSGRELAPRLDSVQHVIYLLFNEGYNSTESDSIIRKDLCAEAIRLGSLLGEYPPASSPQTYALLALMYFHASRLESRIDDKDCIILLEDQDRALWNQDLIRIGYDYFSKAAEGNHLSEYHIEAGIAQHHIAAESFEKTNWSGLLFLYDLLIKINPSPVTSLNRAIVISRVNGFREALQEMLEINGLDSYYLYHAALGEFYGKLGNTTKAYEHLNRALLLTGSNQEKQLIGERIKKLEEPRKESD
jgi:RNA polymerase sigma factor (sigma-70 family)